MHLGNSEVAGHSWHITFSATDPLLFGAWYLRISNAEAVSIKCLDREIREHGRDTMGTIPLGDKNVHEASWCKFSERTNP